MIILHGEGIGRNMGSGRLVVYEDKSALMESTYAGKSVESARFEEALDKTDKELLRMAEENAEAGRRDSAAIFEAHRMLLQDASMNAQVRDLIEEGYACMEAVRSVYGKMKEMLQKTGDVTIALRAADLSDIERQLLANLEGGQRKADMPKEPYILLTKDILPAELMRLDRKYLHGIVLTRGSRLSHAVILAGEFGIPMVLLKGEDAENEVSNYREYEALPAIVDACAGTVSLDVSESNAETVISTCESEDHTQEDMDSEGSRLSARSEKRTYPYALLANVSSPAEAARAEKLGAEGIGLLRSEFLFLERENCPTEEEQYEFYREVLLAMPGKTVTVRTLDLGADKLPGYLALPEGEEDLRGAAFTLKYPKLLHTQLRALYRAARHGKLRIMFPYVNTVEEVSELLSMAEAAGREIANMHELADEAARPETANTRDLPDAAKAPTDVPLGIMIETVTAAEICAELAAMVDFVSIGTNDLGREFLESERRNRERERAGDDSALTEMLLASVGKITEAAHEAGKKVCICGELASEAEFGTVFAKMGVDALSMNPTALSEWFFTSNV